MSALLKNNETEQFNFDAIRIGLASPDKIREWSRGEVKKPETINYRTLKPEKDGLFCEKIFGPTKDWECYCGKYKKIRFKGMVCDKCGVEITKSSVRRERMGHIELATPVSHIWYFKGIPSRMGLVLDVSPKLLERVLYYASYIVTDPKDTDLEYKQVLSEHDYMEAKATYGNKFVAEMGAEAVQKLLAEVDLKKESKSLRKKLEKATGQSRARCIKRLDVIESFIESGNKPEWMVLNVLPVIPPDIRPMVQIDGGRFATSDLNDLYRRIINRNNRLRRLLDIGAPDIIVRNEKRMLQEAVDALIDNGRRGRPVTGSANRPLKSLSDMLKGKTGRFRQNLLGKRVDYSGRSVIVVGPELKIYQCGLPKEMAIELFKPFVIKELVDNDLAFNIKSAKKMVERLKPEVWDVLDDVIKEHPVMLNRAPTLHRLGIQAFEPVLIEGKAIKLHPLVCTAFNADFDGDQMAVHLPLSLEAQSECRFLLLSPNNLLKPSDGGPVAVPSQDMVLGIYYLTQERPGTIGEGLKFKDLNEAILAFENKKIHYHSRITVRASKELPDGKVITGDVESTFGRFLFNEIIPQDLGYVDRSKKGNELLLEVDKLVKKGDLKGVLQRVFDTHGATKTAEVLDDIKTMGYKYSTLAALTVSVSDMTVPESKTKILEDAQAHVDNINANCKMGLLTEEERYKEVVRTWEEADDKLKEDLLNGLDDYNNINMMADSGARGSAAQIKQLAGMRGLMADTTGRTIELPIKANFREGLDVLEYFISAHGARKGLSDTALRTADSGYLTRRLVDVSQELVIQEDDCCGDSKEVPGMYVSEFRVGKGSAELIESLEERITGRYAAEPVLTKKGEVIVDTNQMITKKRAARILREGVDKNGKPIGKLNSKGEWEGVGQVKIRTILTCRCKNGICSKCYGVNMATGEEVQVGEAVGIIAAQSIGEPGTQLTMRTFHTGGVAGGDITQGLPRVEELFEARKPKGVSIVAEFEGKAKLRVEDGNTIVNITNKDSSESKDYLIPYDSHLSDDIAQDLQDGKKVNIEAGQPLTRGNLNPHDILRINGLRAVQDYMIKEVQRVYRLQGVEIDDKHIEVIVRQMLKRIRIDENGDSKYLPGDLVGVIEFEEMNNELADKKKKVATGTQIMMGISKAALATDSFLSAASFQETTKVLTDSAIKGKIDNLSGIKENVILGKLIPAGTGMKRYRSVHLDSDFNLLNQVKAGGELVGDILIGEGNKPTDSGDLIGGPVEKD